MVEEDRYELMQEPLCKALLYSKLCNWTIYFFMSLLIIHLIYIGVFTAIALRGKSPEKYYNMVNITFDSSLCENVSRAIVNGITGYDGMKQRVDYWLACILRACMIPILMKNLWMIISSPGIEGRKLFMVPTEIGAVVLGFCFIYDYDYQTQVTMRCPIQWQIGAFGLFLSYLSMGYYFQYFPIIGVYIIMMIAILQRFFLFLPVILGLVAALGFSFYMIFQNHDPFSNPVISLVKTAMMISGEIDFNDVMYSGTNEAYYKLGYVMFLLFAFGMTIVTINILIGLAVGEVQPLLRKAKLAQLDATYELVRDYEILKVALYHVIFCCRIAIFAADPYIVKNLSKTPYHIRFGRWTSQFLTRELFADELEHDATENEAIEQIDMIREIHKKIKRNPNSTFNSVPAVNPS